LTTAAAMYVLVVADFQGFSQFGAIAGTGIINALIAMLLILPSMLVLFERTGILRLKQQTETKRSAPSHRIFPARRPILIGSIVAIVAAIVFLPRVSFEYRFSELEPTYEEYNDRSAVIRKVRGRSSGRNPAYIVVDTREEIDPLVQAIKLVISSDTTSPTISKVESLQERFPLSADRQQDRLYRLEDIRDQLSDPFIEADSSDDIRRLRRAASTRDVIELENVPEFLRRQFTSKTGDVGNFVMIYPSVGLSDGRASIAFSDDVGTIVTSDGSTYHAGSTSLVAADMLRLMQKESPWMIAATFLIVCLLMYLNFRSVKWTVMALIPLVVGILWMLFLVELTGLKINFYNLIVFPAVLGIGNDAGVHLVHRYREEGVGSILSIVRSTGEHVVMGSVTTMVGFGGLLLSFHPALHSIGQLAVIGIGATLLAAILFLPAMLQEQES
jgi:predicted RND superfamily exporter protein